MRYAPAATLRRANPPPPPPPLWAQSESQRSCMQLPAQSGLDLATRLRSARLCSMQLVLRSNALLTQQQQPTCASRAP